MSKIRHILSVIHYKTRGTLCFQWTHGPCDNWENINTLSYHHHRIGSMNYYPLFRVRSWNNGVRCMSFCIFVIMSSNGIIFRLTGPLRGESTGRRWIPLKSQWRVALVFSLICAWTNGLINTEEFGDLRRHRVHYGITVMKSILVHIMTHHRSSDRPFLNQWWSNWQRIYASLGLDETRHQYGRLWMINNIKPTHEMAMPNLCLCRICNSSSLCLYYRQKMRNIWKAQ